MTIPDWNATLPWDATNYLWDGTAVSRDVEYTANGPEQKWTPVPVEFKWTAGETRR